MDKYTIDQVKHELRDLYQKKSLVPFIGAGFSIPLSLPNWSDLIGKLGEQLDYQKEIFLELGTFQQLAEYVYTEDNSAWMLFLHEMATQFDSKESNERRKGSIQHIALASLDFKTIYTTNYDMHIEKSYSDVGKQVNVISKYEHFLRARQFENRTEVLKFHGSLEFKESIILTENQYFERMDLEGALDQKFRADALTNSFLFIGYSFSDPNIRYIFYKLHKLRKNISNNSNPIYSYIATFGMNNIQAKLLKQWNIKVIELDPSDKEKSITELLNSLK
ncbi:MAG: SIR2 family protein [Tissierellia bacterium]|nr:SIR2 family protein [Tissierellia bacterium]